MQTDTTLIQPLFRPYLPIQPRLTNSLPSVSSFRRILPRATPVSTMQQHVSTTSQMPTAQPSTDATLAPVKVQ